MKIDFDFACQDDCLDKMVPSDLRRIIAESDRQRDRIAELEREKDELVARMVELSKLHSDLTNADMVLDDGEHSGYLITNEQMDKMESLLSVDAECLNQIKAEAVREAVKYCNHYLAFPVSRGAVADVVIAVDEINQYAESIAKGE